MLVRGVPVLLALALAACESCADYGCPNGFTWLTSIAPGPTAAEIEAGTVRLCLNGECTDADASRLIHDLDTAPDGSLSVAIVWDVIGDVLADGDIVSMALLASDGSIVAELRETEVTYSVIELDCDEGSCRSAVLGDAP